MKKSWFLLILSMAFFLAAIYLVVFTPQILASIYPVAIGLVLLAFVPKTPTDSQQQERMEHIGVIALLASIGLGFCSLFAVAFSAIGGGYPHEGGFSVASLLFPLPIGIFALLGLFLSIVVLRGVSSKKLWYILMTYWISLIPFSIFWSLFFSGFMLILIYPVPCIVYFTTDKPRQYFHLS